MFVVYIQSMKKVDVLGRFVDYFFFAKCDPCSPRPVLARDGDACQNASRNRTASGKCRGCKIFLETDCKSVRA